ncbi:unnamed protein product [Caretta caretta]
MNKILRLQTKAGEDSLKCLAFVTTQPDIFSPDVARVITERRKIGNEGESEEKEERQETMMRNGRGKQWKLLWASAAALSRVKCASKYFLHYRCFDKRAWV